MIGLSPKLPLSLSSSGGYTMIQTIVDATKQNLKMLLLTVPGERVMMPEYGVGVKAFLFENDTADLRGTLAARIRNQTKLYMPHVKIAGVQFDPPFPEIGSEFASPSSLVSPNNISMIVKYIIIPLQIQNILSLTLENNQ